VRPLEQRRTVRVHRVPALLPRLAENEGLSWKYLMVIASDPRAWVRQFMFGRRRNIPDAIRHKVKAMDRSEEKRRLKASKAKTRLAK
jgi:hypothetical protein